MSSSAAVVQQPQQKQQVQKQQQEPEDEGTVIESYEKETNASASAGLNLNIFGAVSGMFGSKSRKETSKDGSSVEHREERAKVDGAGHGNAKAAGAGAFHDHEKGFNHIPLGGSDDKQAVEEAPKKKLVEDKK